MKEKHHAEALDSWQTYQERSGLREEETNGDRRALKHHHDRDGKQQMLTLERQKEVEFLAKEDDKMSRGEAKRLRKDQKHRDKVKELYSHPGIAEKTVHGLMVSQFGISGQNTMMRELLYLEAPGTGQVTQDKKCCASTLSPFPLTSFRPLLNRLMLEVQEVVCICMNGILEFSTASLKFRRLFLVGSFPFLALNLDGLTD